MEWDGQRVTIAGLLRTGTWIPGGGGLVPDFDAAEVARAGRRPFGTGECERRLAAIATVGLAGRHLKRIVFLDAEARELGWIPAPYFTPSARSVRLMADGASDERDWLSDPAPASAATDEPTDAPAPL